jgi:regulator of replication initiation timing
MSQVVPVQQPLGCCDTILQTAVSAWNVISDKTCLIYHGITHLFFQTLGLFFPGISDRAEAFWGHITTFWSEIKVADLQQTVVGLTDRQRDLTEKIARVSAENHLLHQENERLKTEVTQLRLNGQAAYEQAEAAIKRETNWRIQEKKAQDKIQQLEKVLKNQKRPIERTSFPAELSQRFEANLENKVRGILLQQLVKGEKNGI